MNTHTHLWIRLPNARCMSLPHPRVYPQMLRLHSCCPPGTLIVGPPRTSTMSCQSPPMFLTRLYKGMASSMIWSINYPTALKIFAQDGNRVSQLWVTLLLWSTQMMSQIAFTRFSLPRRAQRTMQWRTFARKWSGANSYRKGYM